jgi:enamidase
LKKVSAFVALLATSNLTVAQDLLITNARIIDGTGETIEQGSLVVRDGRIVSVSAGASEAQGSLVIDAEGMTVMPGLIDSHTHLLISDRMRLDGEAALSRWISEELPGHLEAYLASGVTTVLAHGDYFPEIIEVKRLVELGELRSPRLLVSGPFLTTSNGHPIRMLCDGAPAFCRASMIAEIDDPETARAKVRELAEAGVDAIKIVYDDGLSQDPRPELTDEVLSAIADEARRHGLPLIAHAREIADALKVIDFGATRLAHPPVLGAGDLTQVGQILGNASVPFATTSNWGLDGIRTLWEAGATIAFGTDGFGGSNPGDAVAREIETISRVLPPAEVIAAVTRHAAAYVNLGDEIGSLQPAKLADIVIIDGDPLAAISDLANVEVVIQGGRIVLDNR